MVSGTRADAEELREEAADVLSAMGLRLSPEKTLITHIDEGLDFLGWRIQRHRKRGTDRHYVYTYPSRKAVKAVMGGVQPPAAGTPCSSRCPCRCRGRLRTGSGRRRHFPVALGRTRGRQ